jgi:repressor LexA
MAGKRAYQSGEMSDRIYRVVKAYMEQYGYAPSIREIARQLDCNSTSYIKYYLDKLQEKGLIERGVRKSRSIRIKGTQAAPVRQARGTSIPLLGRIQAGAPIHVPDSDLARFDEESGIELAEWMLPKKHDGLFALEVQGDSMQDAMISDGDIVILQKVGQPSNGMLVAAWLKAESETTLKKYYLENGQVRLQPANPAYQPIHADPQNVEVQGQVILVIRKTGMVQ